MAGRRGQPIDILIAKGKKHLTKEEIDIRKKGEIKFGNEALLCPAYVKSDTTAFSKWREIKHIYNDVDFVSSSDIGLLGRYCMTHSEYIRLLNQKKHIEEFEVNYEKLLEHFNPELLEGLDAFFKFGPIMQLDNAINKKMDMLIKMEDRLFLNPLAKVRNVPKKEKQVADPLKDQGFENV